MNKKEKLDIIYEDKELLVVNKPAKLLTISTNNEKEKTLFHKVITYVKKKNQKVFIVHRLDKDTSGIVVFAKSESLKKKLQDNWDNLAKIREYVAVVEGHPIKNEGIVSSYLKETKTLYVYSSSKRGDGKKAITHYRKIAGNDKYTMLVINIDTGRKNQIRVHMKDLDCPIVGDKKYEAKSNPINRMALHANKLVLINPKTNKEMTFETDIPNNFINLIK